MGVNIRTRALPILALAWFLGPAAWSQQQTFPPSRKARKSKM